MLSLQQQVVGVEVGEVGFVAVVAGGERLVLDHPLPPGEQICRGAPADGESNPDQRALHA